MEYNFFEVMTGECLLDCGNVASDGHADGCPAKDIEAEFDRLQAIEAAARGVIESFMVTDVWDDEAGTPAREEAIGDMHRDQRLEALAAALDGAK